MTPKENMQISKLDKKLNRFLAISITVFGIAIYLAFDNAGFKREIRAEMKGINSLFEMHILMSEQNQNSIKTIIENNRLNHRELADILLEKGIIKADDITVREGKL